MRFMRRTFLPFFYQDLRRQLQKPISFSQKKPPPSNLFFCNLRQALMNVAQQQLLQNN